jgi:hypothetical protein
MSLAASTRSLQESLGAPPNLPLFDRQMVGEPVAAGPAAHAMVKRRTDTLKPHPSLAKHNYLPKIARLQEIERIPDATFVEPLVITVDGVIIDGHARWLSARHFHVAILPCIVVDLTEAEALQRILQTHRRTQWLNQFCRIRLALDLELWFGEQAKENQRLGGQNRGLSKLTEDRRFDCRGRIAGVAGACTGNVTKVKQLLSPACAPQLIGALVCGEISIHAAWELRKLTVSEQQSALRNRQERKSRQKRLRALVARLPSSARNDSSKVRDLIGCLGRLKGVPDDGKLGAQIDELVGSLEEKFLPTGSP